MKHRNDITGIRGWSILFVVFFHFNIPFFSGGFIGVDIFFVISGFLMTGIITNNLKTKENSWWVIHFYLQRGIRIIPALCLIFFPILIWAWFYLTPQELYQLAIDGIFSLFFLSNELFLRSSGYFDIASQERLLLHTWSLSIEWSFYLIYPILCTAIYLAFKRIKIVFYLVLSITIASFLGMIVFSKVNETTTFFSLATRAWEMGVGALCYFLSKSYKIPAERDVKRISEIFGVTLIVFSLFILDSQSAWPSIYTSLPVIGTAFLLFSNQQNSIITNSLVIQELGKSSYSTYLWHWPIAVISFKMGFSENYYVISAAICLSFILGTISLYVVENPSRVFMRSKSTLKKFIFLLSIIAVSLIPNIVVVEYKGFQSRVISEELSEFLALQKRGPYDIECLSYGKKENPNISCTLGNGITDLLLIGDSHAGSALDALAKGENSNLQTWIQSGCRPIFNQMQNGTLTSCSSFLDFTLLGIKETDVSIPLLIVSRLPQLLEGENATKDKDIKPQIYLSTPHIAFNEAFHAELSSAFAQSVCRLGEGRDIYIVEPTPEFLKNPLDEFPLDTKNIGASDFPTISRDYHSQRSSSTLKAIQLAKDLCGVQIIKVTDIFCDDEKCYSYRNETLLYRDDDHLSLEATILIKDRIHDVIFRNPKSN